MCLGVPMQITAVDGIAGQAVGDHGPSLIDLSLTPDVQAGDWVLTFLGAAREIIDEVRAGQISAALDGLHSLMQGGDLGNAFADLEETGPRLPPHLQAALDAGQTKG